MFCVQSIWPMNQCDSTAALALTEQHFAEPSALVILYHVAAVISKKPSAHRLTAALALKLPWYPSLSPRTLCLYRPADHFYCRNWTQCHKCRVTHLETKVCHQLIGAPAFWCGHSSHKEHHLPASEPTMDQYFAEFVWIFSFSWDVFTADCIRKNISRSALSTKLNSSVFCFSLFDI